MKTIGIRYVFVMGLLGTVASTAQAELKVPEQFLSNKAAVILGLDDQTSLTKDVVKKAAQRLYSRYHPDKFPSKKYSEADIELANGIAKKISSARETLEEFLEVNPGYNPKADADTKASEGTETETKGSGNPFSWEQAYGQSDRHGRADSSAGSSDIVRNDQYGPSFRGTLFEFLDRNPGFEQAFLMLEGRATDVDFNTDLLMIIRRETFPNIEVKVLTKNRGGTAPQLVRSFFAKYVRGHKQGNMGRNLLDGIVFPNGNYLLRTFAEQYPDALRTTPMDENGRRVMITTDQTVYLMEMNPNSYGKNRGYVVSQRMPLEILPRTAAPVRAEKPSEKLAWKSLEIGAPREAIRLGYTSSAPEVKAVPAVPAHPKAKVVESEVKSGMFGIHILKYGTRVNPSLPGASEIFKSALDLALAVAPGSLTAFPAQDSKLDFLIDVTTSEVVANEMLDLESKGAALNNADAYSFLSINADRQLITVRLLWDRLAYKSQNGRLIVREDAYTRIAAALAHEIHGNVRSLWDIQRGHSLVEPSNGFSFTHQVTLEVKAYEAGVAALERMVEIMRQTGTASKKLMSDLRQATLREQSALAQWRDQDARIRADATAKPAPAKRSRSSGKSCEALFRTGT